MHNREIRNESLTNVKTDAIILATVRYGGRCESVRQYIIDMREQRNETQQDVANALGISRQYYAMIERGERQQTLDLMIAVGLATHFGVPVSTIVSQENLRFKKEGA